MSKLSTVVDNYTQSYPQLYRLIYTFVTIAEYVVYYVSGFGGKMATPQTGSSTMPYVGVVLLVFGQKPNIAEIEQVSEVLRQAGNTVVVMSSLGAKSELESGKVFDYGGYYWQGKLYLTQPKLVKPSIRTVPHLRAVANSR